MAFVPPPLYTGNPATDRPRFQKWLREREQEAVIKILLLIGMAGVVLIGTAAVWAQALLDAITN